MKKIFAALLIAALLAGSCVRPSETSPQERLAPPLETPAPSPQIPVPTLSPEPAAVPPQSPVYVPESSAPPIDDHSDVEPGGTDIDKSDTDLPLAGFTIEYTRSDPDRPVREYNAEYIGPIIDTHLHVDPPSSGNISESTLKEIIEAINRAGANSVVVMLSQMKESLRAIM